MIPHGVHHGYQIVSPYAHLLIILMTVFANLLRIQPMPSIMLATEGKHRQLRPKYFFCEVYILR